MAGEVQFCNQLEMDLLLELKILNKKAVMGFRPLLLFY